MPIHSRMNEWMAAMAISLHRIRSIVKQQLHYVEMSALGCVDQRCFLLTSVLVYKRCIVLSMQQEIEHDLCLSVTGCIVQCSEAFHVLSEMVFSLHYELYSRRLFFFLLLLLLFFLFLLKCALAALHWLLLHALLFFLLHRLLSLLLLLLGLLLLPFLSLSIRLYQRHYIMIPSQSCSHHEGCHPFIVSIIKREVILDQELERVICFTSRRIMSQSPS